LQQVKGFAGHHFRALKRQRLAVIALQQRLVVEGIHLRGAAVHEEKDHAFSARRELRRPDGEWAGCANSSRARLFAEQTGQCQTAESRAADFQQIAP